MRWFTRFTELGSLRDNTLYLRLPMLNQENNLRYIEPYSKPVLACGDKIHITKQYLGARVGCNLSSVLFREAVRFSPCGLRLRRSMGLRPYKEF
jgi:hypothetical protein